MNPADAQIKKATEDFSKAFSSGMDKGSTAQDDEKFLGVITLPPGMTTGLMAMWDMAFTSYSRQISDLFFKGTYKFGAETLKIKDTTKLRNASVLAANSLLLVSSAIPNITEFATTQQEQHKKLQEAAKRVSPVLDEIKGKHTLGAFNSINVETNEVIYAHRRRINDEAGIAYTNHFLRLVGKLPMLVKQSMIKSGEYMTFDDMRGMKKLTGDVAELEKQTKEAQAQVRALREGALPEVVSETRNKAADLEGRLSDARSALDDFKSGLKITSENKDEGGKFNMFGPMEIATGGITTVLGAFQNQNKKRFDEKTPASTSLDMILTLERQVSDNPDVASYDLPKGGKSSSRKSLPLKEYVAEIIRHHQLDMEAIDPEYTPIRKALDNQLMEIAEPIAKAIKNGEISTLSLVRLVGEGYIIKNKGRSLAKVSDVKVVLEKMTGNSTAYTQLDPNEYFADAAFNKKELKEALGVLQGEERLQFASMIPDSVLLEAGFGEGEVKDLRAATLKSYEENIGKLIVGLAAQDEQALHDTGLAKEEIKEIREIAEKIKAQGADAVADVRAKPNNPIGIERTLASAAVGQILAGDTHYLGKLTGQSVEIAAKSEPAVEAEEEVVASHAARHATHKKHADAHVEHAAHAARETHRRDHGSEQHEAAV